jgi:hypothetical protein
MNKKIALSAIAIIALAALALFFFFGGQRMLFGPRAPFGGRGDFNAEGWHGDPNGTFDFVKERLGLPADSSNEAVLAELGLPADASQQQVMNALKEMGIGLTGGDIR